jgi:galactokinase/mevalonate kinase-like predicted kinase
VFVQEAAGLTFDICGHVTRIETKEDLEFGDPLPYLDVAKSVWRYFLGDDRRYIDAFGLNPNGGFHLRAETTIPMRAGCAGSTAMMICIISGILRFFGNSMSRYHVAEMARHIERTALGVDCGFQDQYMVVFGGLNCLDFRGKEWGWEDADSPYGMVEPLAEALEPHLPLPMVLANLGKRQGTSGTYHHTPRQRWEAGEEAMVEGMARIAELARIGKRALLLGDWDTVADLMRENYQISMDLFGISEVNDEFINAAISHGATAAKLSGAGGGGTIVAVHQDTGYLAEKLLKQGTKRIIPLDPHQPGLETEVY